MNRGEAAAFGALAGAMLAYPRQAAEAARQGAEMWAGAVLPSLGPYLLCMLMVTSRLPLGLWPTAGLGWLSGSPGGARLMRDRALPRGGEMRFAALTGTMSPPFFLGAAAEWLGGGGTRMLLCHWAGALLLALCLPAGEAPAERAAAGRPLALGEALRETALALCAVALCMMLGCAAARMAACALPFLPAGAAEALQSALEVTSGVRSLCALETPHREALVCAACSFGGLSLLLQNAAFWREKGVAMPRLALLRALHALISGGLCLLLAGH